MNIQHEHTDTKGVFFLEIEGNKVAEMTYTSAGHDTIIIDHTQVYASLKGQAIGYKLLEYAVGYARANKLKIMPLCPFANAVFKKKREYADVLL